MGVGLQRISWSIVRTVEVHLPDACVTSACNVRGKMQGFSPAQEKCSCFDTCEGNRPWLCKCASRISMNCYYQTRCIVELEHATCQMLRPYELHCDSHNFQRKPAAHKCASRVFLVTVQDSTLLRNVRTCMCEMVCVSGFYTYQQTTFTFGLWAWDGHHWSLLLAAHNQHSPRAMPVSRCIVHCVCVERE